MMLHNWFVIFLLFVSSLTYSGEKITFNLSSEESISVDAYPADGDVLLLYLPSERGLGKGYVSTAQQLAFFGKDVWALDLHSSYMLAKRRSSVDKFSVKDVLEVVDISKKQGFKKLFFVTSGRGAKLALKVAHAWQTQHPNSTYLKGHIFHSPHLIAGKPALGSKAQYVSVAKASNLPVYLILSEFSTKYFRAQEIVQTLETGGSSVFTHQLKNVSGGFHMRDAQTLSDQDLVARQNLAGFYERAMGLMSTVKSADIVDINQSNAVNKTDSAFAAPSLIPYTGKQDKTLVLNALKNKTIDISQLQGSVVLVNFWASWCKPCVREIPSLMRLKQQLKNQAFTIVTVNIGESKTAIEQFLKKVPFDLPILFDAKGKAVKEWGVYAYPSNFLLDKKGVIRYVYRGALEWDAPDIVRTIQTLL